MIILKEANINDVNKEYEAIKAIPENENGFENKYHNATKEQFEKEIIPKLINNSKGLELKNGYVPCTYLSVLKTNEASLKVQLKCGAYKSGETENNYLMRIKI